MATVHPPFGPTDHVARQNRISPGDGPTPAAKSVAVALNPWAATLRLHYVSQVLCCEMTIFVAVLPQAPVLKLCHSGAPDHCPAIGLKNPAAHSGQARHPKQPDNIFREPKGPMHNSCEHYLICNNLGLNDRIFADMLILTRRAITRGNRIIKTATNGARPCHQTGKPTIRYE